MKHVSKPFIINFSLCLLFGSTCSAYSIEPLPVPDAGLILRESRPVPQQPKPQADPGVEKSESAKPTMLPQNNLRLSVKTFHFTGNSQFSNQELETLLTAYTHHDIGFKDLQAAANIITEHYRQAGFFLAWAYLPQQSIKQGQVEIVVMEGHLDNSHLTTDTIHAINEVRLNKSVLKMFLDTYQEDRLITEQDMNHLSLLINDLPGIDSKIVLAPGVKIGSSALSLKVKEGSLINGYVSTDKYGLYSTGYYRFDGGVSINDLTGRGDQLNLRAQTTETGGTVSGWADYNLPVNGYGTRFAVNFSELHYSLGESFAYLQARGIARTVGTSLIHPLWLAREGRLTGIAHYEHRWMQDKIGQFSSNNDRELNVMSFSFAGNLYDQLLPASGLTQGYVNVSAGEVTFNDKSAFDYDQQAGGLKSNGGYHKFAWQLSRTQNIIEDFSLFANFQGQVASKNLDTSERMSLGGPNAIRAYPVGEGSAAEGWMINGEARYHLPSIPSIPGYFQLVGFIDTGFSRINVNPLASTPLNSRHLTGYGFGLNFLEVAGFNLRTSIAWRDTKKQPTSDPTSQGPMMYFQLTKTF
jgi:hemolysin activation/secretion protein